MTVSPSIASIDQRVLDALMADVMKEARKRFTVGTSQYEKFKRKYMHQPAKFVRDCVMFRDRDEWAAHYQLDILDELQEKKRIAVRGGRGIGKSSTAAWAILWFALTRDGLDWKIPTTASVWRQVEEFLWPEVHKWARNLRWVRIGRSPFSGKELMKTRLELETGHAFGVASTEPAYVEGAHAKHLLYIFDEARSIPDDIWNATEGAFSAPDTAEALALAISTPGEPMGRFYDIHERRPGLEEWSTTHVKIEDAISVGRISQDWVDNKKALWGEESALYQNQVLGNFATAEDEGLIPIHWIEAANLRHETSKPNGGLDIGIGIDIGRTRDQSVIVVREGNYVRDIHRFPTTGDTMTTTGLIINYLQANNLSSVEPVVDVAGLGAGVVDRLREQGIPVVAFHASESTDFRDSSGELEFLNKRAAGWWKLKESLDPTNENALAIPRDDILLRELTAPHWKPTSTGKIKVESKDDIRKRIHRSTDTADALIMALYGSSIATSFAGGTVGVIRIPYRGGLV